MKGYQSHLVSFFCFLFLFLKSTLLVASNCSKIFSYVQDNSYSRNLPLTELSMISSSYDRFISGVSRLLVDKNSFIRLEQKKSNVALTQKPYPVVDVDIYLKKGGDDLVSSSLVINPYIMLVVLDKNIDKNDIQAIFYQDIKLNIIDEKEYSGKSVYTLLSDVKLDVSDSSLVTNQDNQNIRQFLSLYNVPRNENDLQSFFYPQVGSMIKVFVRKNFLLKDNFLSSIFTEWSGGYDYRRLRERVYFWERFVEVKVDLGITKRRIKELTGTISEESGTFKILTELCEYIRKEVSYYDGRTIKFFGSINPDTERFMNILAKLLSSDSLVKSYTKLFAPNRLLYKLDVNQWFEGHDDLIEELVDIYLDDTDNYQAIETICKRYGVKDMKKELKVAMKRIIWATGRRLYKEDKKIFKGKQKTSFAPTFEGYATVVSSNAVITVSSNLKNVAGETDDNFSDEISIQKGDTFIDALGVSKFSYGYGESKLNISLIRFPDGTFDGVPHAKIGYFEDESRGIMVTESEEENRSVTLVDIFEDPDSYFYYVYPVKYLNLESETENTTTSIRKKNDSIKDLINPSRKGQVIFGSNDQLIGFLRGASAKFQVTMITEGIDAFIKQAINEDPKLKIRGINE